MPKPPASLGRLLNFATSATNALCNERLAAHGLTLAHWVMLSALWREDDLPLSDLARYSGHALPAASRLVERMEKKGYVTRRMDPDDRRAVRVALTPRGAALHGLMDFYRGINAALLDGFTPGEAASLLAMLERVTRNARAAAGE